MKGTQLCIIDSFDPIAAADPGLALSVCRRAPPPPPSSSSSSKHSTGNSAAALASFARWTAKCVPRDDLFDAFGLGLGVETLVRSLRSGELQRSADQTHGSDSQGDVPTEHKKSAIDSGDGGGGGGGDGGSGGADGSRPAKGLPETLQAGGGAGRGVGASVWAAKPPNPSQALWRRLLLGEADGDSAVLDASPGRQLAALLMDHEFSRVALLGGSFDHVAREVAERNGGKLEPVIIDYHHFGVDEEFLRLDADDGEVEESSENDEEEYGEGEGPKGFFQRGIGWWGIDGPDSTTDEDEDEDDGDGFGGDGKKSMKRALDVATSLGHDTVAALLRLRIGPENVREKQSSSSSSSSVAATAAAARARLSVAREARRTAAAAETGEALAAQAQALAFAAKATNASEREAYERIAALRGAEASPFAATLGGAGIDRDALMTQACRRGHTAIVQELKRDAAKRVETGAAGLHGTFGSSETAPGVAAAANPTTVTAFGTIRNFMDKVDRHMENLLADDGAVEIRPSKGQNGNDQRASGGSEAMTESERGTPTPNANSPVLNKDPAIV